MFSASAEYAINMLTAMPKKTGESISTKKLAKMTKTPAAYASKVFQALRRKGFIASRRGVGGGVTLVKPLNKISVADVLEAVDGVYPPTKKTVADKHYAELRKFLAKRMLA